MKKVLVINNCQWWTQDCDHVSFLKILNRISDVIRSSKFDTVILTKETDPNIYISEVKTDILPQIYDAAKKYAKDVKIVEKSNAVDDWEKVLSKYKDIDLTYIEMSNDTSIVDEASRIIHSVGNVRKCKELFYELQDARKVKQSATVPRGLVETAIQIAKRTSSSAHTFIESNIDEHIFHWQYLKQEDIKKLQFEQVWGFIVDAIDGRLDDNYEFVQDINYTDFVCGARLILKDK